eukprot:NODE_636_length_5742_cov_0.129364.p2 type:complete len:205 gc:universal NODE_636_length_5742_cov_0.129364:4474-3860(-)
MRDRKELIREIERLLSLLSRSDYEAEIHRLLTLHGGEVNAHLLAMLIRSYLLQYNYGIQGTAYTPLLDLCRTFSFKGSNKGMGGYKQFKDFVSDFEQKSSQDILQLSKSEMNQLTNHYNHLNIEVGNRADGSLGGLMKDNKSLDLEEVDEFFNAIISKLESLTMHPDDTKLLSKTEDICRIQVLCRMYDLTLSRTGPTSILFVT